MRHCTFTYLCLHFFAQLNTLHPTHTDNSHQHNDLISLYRRRREEVILNKNRGDKYFKFGVNSDKYNVSKTKYLKLTFFCIVPYNGLANCLTNIYRVILSFLKKIYDRIVFANLFILMTFHHLYGVICNI